MRDVQLERYGDFRPTAMDPRGLGLDDRQDWLVGPVTITRDSGPLDTSNWETALECFRALDPDGRDWEVHRFGHWGPGWFEIVLLNPGTAVAMEAAKIAAALSDYPVLDETDFSEREHEEANRVWADCYCERERVAYIRKNRSQFEFRSFADLRACVRGEYFGGYASELIS